MAKFLADLGLFSALVLSGFSLIASLAHGDEDTDLKCILVVDDNCGQGMDNAQCREVQAGGTYTCSDGSDCASCASSSAVSTRLCVFQEGADDCEEPGESFSCGTSTFAGVCEIAGGTQGCECDASGPSGGFDCGEIGTCN